MELINLLKKLLANLFVLRFNAQSYHWNIEGKDFYSKHTLFGEIYLALDAQVDIIAEILRQLDERAPLSLVELYAYNTLVEDTEIPDDMVASLSTNFSHLVLMCNEVIDLATIEKNHNIINVVSNLVSILKKYIWFLNSMLKQGQ